MQKEVITYKTISGNSLPENLKQLAQVPSSLYLKGNAELLEKTPIVGIVGARKFTPYGREVTQSVASTLAKSGIPVISGLALGVDSIAHRVCVELRSPTIAVLPCGIESVYPASHRGLAHQILDTNGLLISEYGGKLLPQKHQFIERNRIIAALSDILIIPEAAEKSGSLHTARFALELGKTIMVVPGNITSPYSMGTNRLIHSGAIPLLSPDDVLDELGIKQDASTQAYLPENEAEAAILIHMKNGPILSDDLFLASQLDTSVFQTHLTMLEIKGVIQATAGRWCLK
jgi:DNA processing protein